MRILALETSTEYCSVALWQDGEILSRSELVGQKHSERLIGMLDELLRDAGFRVSQMDAIAFGMGPGSFTGVRIACGATQGLALGADLPVIPVCTLEALAEATSNSRVITALDARMGEIYHAVYEKDKVGWQMLSAPMLCKPEDAPRVEGNGWVGTGSGFAVYGEALASRYAGQIQTVEAAVPQASSIVILAAAKFSLQGGVDAAQAHPLYLRDKVALKTREREALKSASTGK